MNDRLTRLGEKVIAEGERLERERNRMTWGDGIGRLEPETRARETEPLTQLVEQAMHLVMNGERAPGGDETWADWYQRAENHLRNS